MSITASLKHSDNREGNWTNNIYGENTKSGIHTICHNHIYIIPLNSQGVQTANVLMIKSLVIFFFYLFYIQVSFALYDMVKIEAFIRANDTKMTVAIFLVMNEVLRFVFLPWGTRTTHVKGHTNCSEC